MGGGLSSLGSINIRQDWMETFTAMQLSPGDVKKLSKVFATLEADATGTVNIMKMLSILEIDKTRFNERLFATFDKDKTGCINLYAFVVSLWKFCCLEGLAINAFVFEIYDTNNDGRITSDQIEKMFLDLFGTKGMEQETNRTSLAECLKKTNYEGFMNMKTFQAFCKTRQMMLSPVFNVQKALQKVTLGSAGWESVSNRIVEVHFGRKVTVRALLALHNDVVLFANLLDEDAREQVVSELTRTVLRNSVHKFRSTVPALTIKTSAPSSSKMATGPSSWLAPTTPPPESSYTYGLSGTTTPSSVTPPRVMTPPPNTLHRASSGRVGSSKKDGSHGSGGGSSSRKKRSTFAFEPAVSVPASMASTNVPAVPRSASRASRRTMTATKTSF